MSVLLANQVPGDSESRQIFAEAVGVVRAALLLSRIGEQCASGFGKRTTGRNDFDDVGELHSIEYVEALNCLRTKRLLEQVLANG